MTLTDAAPFRFVVCTLNLWRGEDSLSRHDALRAFLGSHEPDVLAVQELSAEARTVIDGALPDHESIDDPFAGWTTEGTIYWRRASFERLEHGADDIGQRDPNRRLFWVRLGTKGGATVKLLVATLHLTWPGHPEEVASGVSPRPLEARRAAEALLRRAGPDEAIILAGDFNDCFHPLHVLRKAGFIDCFSALGRVPPPTIPAAASHWGPSVTSDWLLHRGPIRPMTVDAVDFLLDGRPPSDHRPLLATYRLKQN